MFGLSFIVTWLGKKLFAVIASKYIEPIISFIAKHWKISLFLLLIGTNAYAFNKVQSLKIDNAIVGTELEQKEHTIFKLNLSIEVQNLAIAEGNEKYISLLDQQKVSVIEIAKLDNTLRIAMDTISSEVIGSDCKDKIEYLRESTEDLKW